MTLTPKALRQARAMRVEVDAVVDAATRDLAKAWASAWDEIAAEWEAAVADLAASGGWPTRAQIMRAQRAQRALTVTTEALNDLGKTSGVRILHSLPDSAATGADWAGRITLSQLPSGVMVDWAAVNPSALAAIVKRVTGQVEKTMRRLPADQAAVMKQTLIRGVAVGENPNRAASIMLQRLEGVFDGGRRRAETIARTEILDAHRAGAQASRTRNQDLLAGWEWQATLDVRTCPACLSMHGRVFPVDESGPAGHPNCRCASLPVLKPWRDLGFDMDDPAPGTVDARSWFDSQPEKTQLQIMGPERLRRLRSGDLDWDELAVRRENAGWRDSFAVRPLAA